MAGQDTGGVHLTHGVLGGVNGHIVVIQQGTAAAKVHGIQIIFALGGAQRSAGAAGRKDTAQLNAHLLDPGVPALLYGSCIPAAGIIAQQLNLHQPDLGVLARTDAGEGSGGTVFGIAPQHLHDGQAAARFCIHRKAGQSCGMGGIQCHLQDHRLRHGHTLSHGQCVTDRGVFDNISVCFSTHAALGKGGKVALGFPHPCGQDIGEVDLAPEISGKLRQRRCFRGAVHAALVPSCNRQAVHVQIIHKTSGPPLSRCCPSFPGGSDCSSPRRIPRAVPWQWARQSRPRSGHGHPPPKGHGSSGRTRPPR